MMTMIPVTVFTNEDNDKRIEWPRTLYVRPVVGEWMQSVDGKSIRPICNITHTAQGLQIEVKPFARNSF